MTNSVDTAREDPLVGFHFMVDLEQANLSGYFTEVSGLGSETETIEHKVVNGGIEVVHHPPWTTDWITERGRRALHAYGIAPPPPVGEPDAVACPRCRSEETTTVSHFGSTACKALMVCRTCREPFDLFKAL